MGEVLMSGEPETQDANAHGDHGDHSDHGDEADTTVGVVDREESVGSSTGSAVDDATDDESDDESDATDDETDEETDERRRPSWALTIGLGVVAVLAVAALAVTMLIVPGWAVKPGSPDDTAGRVTTALALKDAGTLEAASCRNPQGGTANPFPPELLQVIGSVRTAGPARLQLDTQATAPVDLTATAAGQTQTLPADLVLAVDDGHWCLAGISQRQ